MASNVFPKEDITNDASANDYGNSETPLAKQECYRNANAAIRVHFVVGASPRFCLVSIILSHPLDQEVNSGSSSSQRMGNSSCA